MNLWRTFLDRLVLLPSKPATADWLSRQYYRFQINHTEEQSHNLFLMLNFSPHCFLYRACMCLLCTSSCTTSCVGQLKQVTQLRWVDRIGRILCTREWDPPLWEATSANQLKISSVPWKRYTYRAYIVITLTCKGWHMGIVGYTDLQQLSCMCCLISDAWTFHICIWLTD